MHVIWSVILSEFYTSVAVQKSNILVCGYKDGRRFKKKVHYKPYLFVPTHDKNSRYRTIFNAPVEKMHFSNIFDARKFVRDYEDVDNFKVYGMTNFEYPYIYDTYRIKDPNTSLIKVCILDIEVSQEGGNPDIELADKMITAITMMYKDITFALGYHDFVTDDPSIKYVKCKDEVDLLKKFLKIWTSDLFRPDVVTGWNIEVFDIPYMVNRISNLLSYEDACSMSPWQKLDQRTFEVFGKEKTAFTPVGVNVLDYLAMYKKFTYSQQESYKLDHIAFVELEERKLDYSEYGSLKRLYKLNPQLFMEYNIRDCALIQRLDNKMKLLDLVYRFAFSSGTNFVDALAAVKPWDVAIHNYLMDRKYVVPQRDKGNSIGGIVGAFVKDPQTGLHEWVISFDITSLYPHLIIAYNISPDTFKGMHRAAPSIDQLLDGALGTTAAYLDDNKLTMAANGAFFTKDKQGFLAILMEQLFEERKQYKDQMLIKEQEAEKDKSEQLRDTISMLYNFQQAAKIKLNSAYGALVNDGNRWKDKRLGEAVTMSGQLTIRWAEAAINLLINDYLKTTGVDYVIAVDTDSVYLKANGIVEKYFPGQDKKQTLKNLDKFCVDVIQPRLKQTFTNLAKQQRCIKDVIHMKREVIADRGVFVAKKRYILNMWVKESVWFDKPKLKIMGIEAVRSSTPESCRTAIKKALEIMMSGTNEQLIEYIDQFRSEFKKMPFDQVAFPRGMNGLNKYYDRVTLFKKKTPPHVKGTILYNQLIDKYQIEDTFSKIYDREKVKYCYLKLPNPLRYDIIAAPDKLPKEFGLDEYIDYDTQFTVAFLDPLARILDKMGWEIEKQHTLESFYE